MQQKKDSSLRLPASPSRQNQLLNSLSLSNSLLQQIQLSTIGVIPPGMMMGSSTHPAQNPQVLLGRSTLATEAARRTHLAQSSELDRQQMLQHLLGGGINTIKEENARREFENHLMLRDISGIDPLTFTNHISSIDRNLLLARTMARNVGLQYQFSRQPDEVATNQNFPSNFNAEINLTENGSRKRKSSFVANENQAYTIDKHENSSHKSSTPDINISKFPMAVNKEDESIATTRQGSSKNDKILKGKAAGLENRNDLRDKRLGEKATFPIRVKPSRKKFRLNSDGRFPSLNQIWNNLDKKIVSNYPNMDRRTKRKLLGDLFVDILYESNDLTSVDENDEQIS